MGFLDKLKRAAVDAVALSSATYLDKNRDAVNIERRSSIVGDASNEDVRTFWTYSIYKDGRKLGSYNPDPGREVEAPTADIEEMKTSPVTDLSVKNRVIDNMIAETRAAVAGAERGEEFEPTLVERDGMVGIKYTSKPRGR